MVRLVTGCTLVACGLAFALLDVHPDWNVQRLWPSLAVAFGISRVFARSKWIQGVILFVTGATILLSNLGAYELPSIQVVHFWPMILVVIGLVELARAAKQEGLVDGLLLWGVGLWLQLSYFGLKHLSSYRAWPLLLSLIGGGMIREWWKESVWH